MKGLLVLATILSRTLVWAHGEDRILCEAGIKKNHTSYSTELYRQTRGSDDLMSGILKTDKAVYEFTVIHTQDGYQYQAHVKGDANLLIDEAVPSLPSILELPLNKDETLFINCLPYTLIDYCRMHTC